MANIIINLDDKSGIEVSPGTLVRDILREQLGEDAKGVIGLANGTAKQALDLASPVQAEGSYQTIRLKDDNESVRYLYRHTFSHILAQAVKRLYPNAKLAIGPAIAEGFYYDFDIETPFTPEDLSKIEKEMKKVIKENHRVERFELELDEAKKLIEEKQEPYKLELLEDVAGRGEKITFYQDGEFVDLCRGPHIPYTNQVKHFKLLDIAGAYWKGNEKNKMLQRIYGTAFLKKEDLEQHLWRLEEAKKRDHRRLGKELDLFSTNPEEIGPGLILWHPKGGLIRHLMEEHCKQKHLASGYDFVVSPHVGLSKLWKTSGHLDFYKEGMYPCMELDEQEYYVKPMNCPFHAHIYKSQLRSYRDLPLRFAEWGTVYRYERSGAVSGLTRVRGFTQDDAHLFCRIDQMPAEIDEVLSFSLATLKDFGLTDFHMYLSTRPEERVGDEADWDKSEKALQEALERSGEKFTVNPGDGAFYGPKIDICVNDSIGREWQLSTIQFDFNLPERFDLTYRDSEGNEVRPYMIHRALLGSMERFFGILIEHYAGAFPYWLAPVQAVAIPIAERHHDYAQELVKDLKGKGVRVEIDSSSNTLGKKIRTHQKLKVPYMFVIGDKEVEAKKMSVRRYGEEDLGAMSAEEFLSEHAK